MVNIGSATETDLDASVTYLAQIGTPNMEDVSFAFDSDTGTMIISGTGEFLPLGSVENIPSSVAKETKILNIGNGITKIPASMFSSNPENLEQISFPDTLTEIGGGNFNSCSKITELTFPKSLKKISGGCFVSLTSLQTVTFSEGLETIEGGAFSNCLFVKKLVFPSTLTTMPMAFGNSTLENVEIGGENVAFVSSGNGITNISAKNLVIRGGTIYSGAFSGKNIETLELKATVKLNGSAQFIRCSKLKSVLIENGITGISTACFNNCALIDNIELPNSVVELGESAFAGCSSLKNITLSINIKKIPDSCFSATGIEIFSIPDDSGIEEIEDDIFYNCPSLKNICIGKNVKIISSKAFRSADSPVIKINQKENSISGAPWGASNATVEWIGGVKAVKIEIISLPDKTKYKKDESFDSTGLIVKYFYDDETEEEITDYTLSSVDMSTVGTKTVTVTFKEQTTTFNVEIIDVTGIEVTTLPLKTEYRKGDVLDTTGLTISTVWTDGSKEVLAEGYTVSDLDSTKIGEKTVTVTYQTFSTTFTVAVVADTIGIRISSYPDRIYYRIGETSFDRTGMKIVKIRADETEKEVTDYNVLGFDSSKAGTCTVRISYTESISGTESETFYTVYDVQITNDGENPFADDTAEIAIKVHWPNGEFEDLENKDIVTGSMSLKEGICEDQYFIFGGCLHNMITFDTHAEQFLNTEESSTPHGKIEVTIECNNTPVRMFTGEIDSGKRLSDLETRRIVAYDELYKYRNADISRWLKSKIGKTVPAKTWTQKEFRDNLFSYLGIKQAEAKLYYDNAYIPNTQADNEINAVDTLKDMCLQNKVFGWMDRYGEFQYLDISANSYIKGYDKQNNELYGYYEAEIHADLYEKFEFKEGRIWHPRAFYSTPDPYYWFGSGEPSSAQEAYESNTYYNRNSFFIGDLDWLDYAWDVDEYGATSLEKPLFEICYGPISKWDAENADQHLYRAQEYSLTLPGNPMNKPGQTIEIMTRATTSEGKELTWIIHSYIMSRTLRILGDNCLEDTYTAKNAPYNGNNQQLGRYVPKISAETNRTRSQMPVISYEFTDGSDFSSQSTENSGTKRKLVRLRCLKQMNYDDYKALSEAEQKNGTVYYTYEEK